MDYLSALMWLLLVTGIVCLILAWHVAVYLAKRGMTRWWP